MDDQSPLHAASPGVSARRSRRFSFRRLRRWFERLGRFSPFDAYDEPVEALDRTPANDYFEDYRARVEEIERAAAGGAPPDAFFKSAYDAYGQGQAQRGTDLNIERNKLKAKAEQLDARINQIMPAKRRPTLADSVRGDWR
jgi:hypothetical protein